MAQERAKSKRTGSGPRSGKKRAGKRKRKRKPGTKRSGGTRRTSRKKGAKRPGRRSSHRGPPRMTLSMADGDATVETGAGPGEVIAVPDTASRRATGFSEQRIIVVGTERISPGELKHINFKVTETAVSSPVYMPVTVVNGERPGPSIFISGAVHGDELNGVQIAREVIERLDPSDVAGAVVCIPVVNVLGFQQSTRYLPDRRDLNREFPGEEDGTLAERYAAHVFRLVSQCNYGIDLHTATLGRSNMPHVRGEIDIPEIRRMARAFGTEVIMDRSGHSGSIRANATKRGIPTILLEAGEAVRFQRSVVKEGVQGVFNVLHELGIVEGETVEPQFRVIVKKTEWVRTDRGGIVEMRTHPRALVYQGDEICVVSNPFGRDREVVRAPFNGMIVGVTTRPLATPGTPIVHLVKLDKTLERIERVLAAETGAVCRL